MKNLAIIPARSGSKGLEDKNIKLLRGKPLLAYTIESALSSNIFDEVYVSTDSKNYAEIATQYNAEVPFLRNSNLATDEASTIDVIVDALERYEKMGKLFDTVTILQPTSPMRSAQNIVDGYKLFKEKKASSVISVCLMDHSPLWSNQLPENKSMINFINKEELLRRRQELPPYYRINGALYIIDVKLLKKTSDIYSDNSYAYIMNKKESVDIDDDLDFKFAEFLMNYEV